MLFIETTPVEVIMVIITATLGMLSISIGMIGYFINELNWPFRILCIAGGLLMIYPGTVTDLMGVAILIIVYVVEKMRTGRRLKAQ